MQIRQGLQKHLGRRKKLCLAKIKNFMTNKLRVLRRNPSGGVGLYTSD
jgi:hypothetical protein